MSVGENSYTRKSLVKCRETQPSLTYMLSLGVARFSCLDGGEAYNERVITVGIGWVLLASATSGFSGYISLPTAPLPRGLQ